MSEQQTNSDDEFDDAFDRFTDDYDIEGKSFSEMKAEFRMWQSNSVRTHVSWKQHSQLKRKFNEHKMLKDIIRAVQDFVTIKGKKREVYRDPFTGKFAKKPD